MTTAGYSKKPSQKKSCSRDYRYGGGGYGGNGYGNSYGYRGYGHGYRHYRYAQPQSGYPYGNQYRHGGDYCRCGGDDNDG